MQDLQCYPLASLPKPVPEPSCFQYKETAGEGVAKAASGNRPTVSPTLNVKTGRDSVRLSCEKETQCRDQATTAEVFCA